MNIHSKVLSIIIFQAVAVQGLRAICSYTETYTDRQYYYVTKSSYEPRIGFWGDGDGDDDEYDDWTVKTVLASKTVYKTRWQNKCCSGYILEDLECVPLCANGCENGICLAPDVCSCFEGYRTDENNRCTIPVCVDGCINGTCIAPNTCKCHMGYRLTSDGNKCEPICSQKCENGFCHLPEKCVCNEGYQIAVGSDYQCKPVCSDACVNGFCVEPEKCQCLEGYHMTSGSDRTCDPICEPGCANADCVGPNSCTCWEDYVQINRTSCDTYCSVHMHCTNGYCSSPKTCKCNEGYEPQSEGSNICIAVCKDCDFGYCQAPGVCVCWPGYKMDEISLLCYSTTTISTESTDTTEMTITTETVTVSLSSQKMFDLSYYDSYEKDSTFRTTTKDEVSTQANKALSDSEKVLFCDCWSLDSDSSTSDCILYCNMSSQEKPCINLDLCQMAKNQKDLGCNGKTYKCRTTLGTTSARTQVWSIWVPLGTIFSAVTLIGTVLIVRHFRQQRNGVRSHGDEISHEYVVEYVERN